MIIPLLARISDEEEALWCHALEEHLHGIQIVPFAKLDNSGNHKLAIVANPDPQEVMALKGLEWVQSLWAGVEGLLAEPTLENIKIARMIDPQLADTMAEAVLAWTLYLHRDMPAYAALQKQRRWHQLPYRQPNERRVTILGLGKLGQKAAETLAANKFTVQGWSRSTKKIAGVETFAGTAGWKKALAQTDILVNLLPLTEATKGLLNKQAFNAMQRGSSLINFGRGPVVNSADLLDALDGGVLRYAVLDVFEKEPLPVNSQLWAHPKITVLPHISAPTTIETAARVAAANIKTYLETGVLPETVDRTAGY